MFLTLALLKCKANMVIIKLIILFIPPSISYTQNIIGVSTVNEKLTITYHGMKSDEENSWFNELICILSK